MEKERAVIHSRWETMTGHEWLVGMVNRDWRAIKNKETKESPSSRVAFSATLALPAVRTRIGRP